MTNDEPVDVLAVFKDLRDYFFNGLMLDGKSMMEAKAACMKADKALAAITELIEAAGELITVLSTLEPLSDDVVRRLNYAINRCKGVKS